MDGSRRRSDTYVVAAKGVQGIARNNLGNPVRAADGTNTTAARVLLRVHEAALGLAFKCGLIFPNG